MCAAEIMAYEDVKEFEGHRYTGMSIGGEHVWTYPKGRWRERKVAPERWEFTFASVKERERSAPEGSGVPEGTQFHWYILAHQRARKVDKDCYTTFMEGVKHKIAHRRPHWRRWSSEYPDQRPERDRLVDILEAALTELREGPSPEASLGEVEEGDPFEGQIGGRGLRDRPLVGFVDAQHFE